MNRSIKFKMGRKHQLRATRNGKCDIYFREVAEIIRLAQTKYGIHFYTIFKLPFRK